MTKVQWDDIWCYKKLIDIDSEANTRTHTLSHVFFDSAIESSTGSGDAFCPAVSKATRAGTDGAVEAGVCECACTEMMSDSASDTAVQQWLIADCDTLNTTEGVKEPNAQPTIFHFFIIYFILSFFEKEKGTFKVIINLQEVSGDEWTHLLSTRILSFTPVARMCFLFDPKGGKNGNPLQATFDAVAVLIYPLQCSKQQTGPGFCSLITLFASHMFPWFFGNTGKQVKSRSLFLLPVSHLHCFHIFSFPFSHTSLLLCPAVWLVIGSAFLLRQEEHSVCTL